MARMRPFLTQNGQATFYARISRKNYARYASGLAAPLHDLHPSPRHPTKDPPFLFFLPCVCVYSAPLPQPPFVPLFFIFHTFLFTNNITFNMVSKCTLCNYSIDVLCPPPSLPFLFIQAITLPHHSLKVL